MSDSLDLPYRDCVGICVFNAQNKVWTGERFSAPGSANSRYSWQLPQGGIDKGEDPLSAAKRELFEETSIESISLLREAPDWFHYDFPKDVVKKGKLGKYRGQRQRWFAFRFDGDDSEINILNPGDGCQHQEFQNWRWESLSKTPQLIVPFKRSVYEQVVGAFADLAD